MEQQNNQPPKEQGNSSGSGSSGSGAPKTNTRQANTQPRPYDFNAMYAKQYWQQQQRERNADIDKDQPFWEWCLLKLSEIYHGGVFVVGCVLAAFAFTAGVRATHLSQALADSGGIGEISTWDSLRIVFCNLMLPFLPMSWIHQMHPLNLNTPTVGVGTN